ncbi:piggyBac transposable element-derived protein 3-like [Palaemon carinicauda]|uniref:piggyBac transposable element-derived protein 3-like n=1 Tax=Palaemon carinicauda TaxID=392227 RepID=UPI0035B5C43B
MNSMANRYVGTARINRIGYPLQISLKELEKKPVPQEKHEAYSTDEIHTKRWKDSSIITGLSSYAGVVPLNTVLHYDKQGKKKVEAPCPYVIKKIKSKIGAIDKSDMLIQLKDSSEGKTGVYQAL